MNSKEIQNVGQEIAKTKRKSNGRNSPVIGDNGISATPGELAEITRNALTVAMWESIDKDDPRQIQQRIMDYLNYCIDHGTRPGNMGMYNALGIDRRRIYDMISKEPSSPRVVIIKKGMSILGEIREQLMSSGKINPITGIFWQKNYDGLKDVQEIEIAPRSALGDGMSADEIAKSIGQNDVDIIDIEDL